MRLYELTLVSPEEDVFIVGYHSGTRGEAALKAKYTARRLGVPLVTCPGEDVTGTERVVITDIGPAEWEGVLYE